MTTTAVLNPGSTVLPPPPPSMPMMEPKIPWHTRAAISVYTTPRRVYRSVKRAITRVFGFFSSVLRGAYNGVVNWLNRHPGLTDFAWSFMTLVVGVFTFCLAFLIGYLAALGLILLVVGIFA